MESKFIIDPSLLDLDNPIADINAIRVFNPQRHEMEQLSAILYEDVERKVCAALKEITDDEFWVRGHMPGFPLLPGVLICEAAAQLCSYYATTNGLNTGDFIAFGGMENVRFRGAVKPGDRLVIAIKAIDIRPRRRALFTCQGIVGSTLVFHGDVIGVPFSTGSR